MTSLHVICGLAPSQLQILATPMVAQMQISSGQPSDNVVTKFTENNIMYSEHFYKKIYILSIKNKRIIAKLIDKILWEHAQSGPT